MLPTVFYSFLLIRVFLITTTISADVPAATDVILLNCGAPTNLNDTSGRRWDSDVRSRYAPPNTADISSAHNATYMDGSVPGRVPYLTVRVFHSPFTYTFPVFRGPKFLRLYFHPAMYSDYNASLFFFSVTANGFTLLSNFNAFLNSPQPNYAYMQEFVIDIQGEQRLNLTFFPNTNSSAFVNGIEIVSIPDNLRLSLFPELPKHSNALLSGLETFKLSGSKRSLQQWYDVSPTTVSPPPANPTTIAPPPTNPDPPTSAPPPPDSVPSPPDPPPAVAPPPDPPTTNSSPPALKLPRNNKSGSSVIYYAVIGSVIGVLVVVAAVFSVLFLRWRQQKLKNSITADANSSWVTVSTSTISTTMTTVPLLSDLCRHFSLEEIKTATRNFDDQFIIGRGGFGNVYKGFINDSTATAAIKRLNPSSNQGISEFLTEIQMLSKLRHTHLLSLIGYCDENGEMILVYDYMEHGTLRNHLCNSESTPLTWKQRLQICIGAAKGLNYLHSGSENAVIHRDVKSTNILLDENWVAKISDFGLCKMGPVNDSFTHITTIIKGTYGYLDPDYFSSHKLTTKSDVYAFGVVLFEVLSGRPAVDVTLEEEEQHSLAMWARCCIREGKLDRLIDRNLAGQISPACLKVFAEIAGRCLLVRPHGRPLMADVVMGLELAALQQSDYPTDCNNNLQHCSKDG